MEEKLNPDSIMVAELGYIARTAFQANEDRAKVTTVFILTVGTFLAALLSLQFDISTSQPFLVALAILFTVLSIYAMVTLLQLVRLRQAWHESILAMNQIKRFYVEHIPGDSLSEAFAWSGKTIPPKFKPWSISFLLAVQVTMLGAASLASAVLILGFALSGELHSWMWFIGLIVALIYFLDLLAIYWWLLREVASDR